MDNLSVCASVRTCIGLCVGLSNALWKTADQIQMPFGIIGRAGPGMRQIVQFRDRAMERGTFGPNLGQAIVTNGDYGLLVMRHNPFPLTDLFFIYPR